MFELIYDLFGHLFVDYLLWNADEGRSFAAWLARMILILLIIAGFIGLAIWLFR